MIRGDAEEATPLQHALGRFATALHHLFKIVDDGALDDLDARGLVAFGQDFETIRNRMPGVDHLAIRAGLDRDVPRSLPARHGPSAGRCVAHLPGPRRATGAGGRASFRAVHAVRATVAAVAAPPG